MSEHDRVVAHVAATRFPFAGQTTWPADYVTITNAPKQRHGIPFQGGLHYPDIAIVDAQGRLREAGEVLTTIDPAEIPALRTVSEATDDTTPARVRHFFVYVPAGSEQAAMEFLDEAKISYAGVRGFTCEADGRVRIVPFVTPGHPYDDQAT